VLIELWNFRKYVKMMPKVSLQRKSYEVLLLDALLGRSKIPNLQTQRVVFTLRVLDDYDLTDLCG
jgi:hypothetical protein